MKKIKFSIIIPVYNSENSLKQCIDSILGQTYKNYEIIIINDGSEDNSINICNNYRNYDQRIKIYNQENRGVSYSRNKGIKKSKGEYLVFIDSDDYIEKDMLEILDKETKKDTPDILYFGIKFIDLQRKLLQIKAPSFNSLSLDKEYIYNDLKIKNEIFGFTWSKIIKRDIVIENNILYNENMELYEDLVFTCKVFKKVKTIKTIKKPLYNYVIGENDSENLSKKYRKNMKELKSEIILFLVEFMDDMKFKDSIKLKIKLKNYENFIDYMIVNYLNEKKLKKDDKKISKFYKEIMNDNIFKDFINIRKEYQKEIRNINQLFIYILLLSKSKYFLILFLYLKKLKRNKNFR